MGSLQVETAPAGLGYRLLRIALDRFSRPFGDLDEWQAGQVEQIAAKELALEQLVLSSPDAVAVSVPPAQAGAALDQVRNRYQDEAQFQAALAEVSLSEPVLREALSRELKVDAVLERIGERVPPVDDTEAEIFYHLHRDRFTRPERRTARHILITINPEFPENTEAAAHERAEAILARLRKSPQRFEEQALKHSECPTSFQGGLLGDVSAGALYPELEAVLFQLGEGEFAGPVASPLGFHLLLCERIHREGPVPFDEVREALRTKLNDRRRASRQKQWLKSLAAEAAGHLPQEPVT